jgi:transcriptional regulator with XRE-family HTH domain
MNEAAEPMYDFSILRDIRKHENLSIADLTERSGVSAAVISKLERNQITAGLETLGKLARAFGISAADLIKAAENRHARLAEATERDADGFHFHEISYSNMKGLLGTAPAGTVLERPHLHRSGSEMCWVLKGRVVFSLPEGDYDLSAGQSIMFDALHRHRYRVLQDCELFIVHLKEGFKL